MDTHPATAHFGTRRVWYRTRYGLIVAVALAAAALAAAACCFPDRGPAKVWVGYVVTDDLEQSMPGLYAAPHGARIDGFEADYSEDVLMLVRTDTPAWIERLRQALSVRAPAPIEYRTSGGRVDEPGRRWAEFARVEAD